VRVRCYQNNHTQILRVTEDAKKCTIQVYKFIVKIKILIILTKHVMISYDELKSEIETIK